jgi:hypothetical protein
VQFQTLTCSTPTGFQRIIQVPRRHLQISHFLISHYFSFNDRHPTQPFSFPYTVSIHLRFRTMKTLSAPFLLAVTAIPSNAFGFVPSVNGRPSSTSTTLKVSIGETSQLTPPKKVEDLANTAEEIYNQHVQTTYGYVRYTCGCGCAGLFLVFVSYPSAESTVENHCHMWLPSRLWTFVHDEHLKYYEIPSNPTFAL